MVVGWLDVGLGPGNGTGLEGNPLKRVPRSPMGLQEAWNE